jgi:hypothetical protein
MIKIEEVSDDCSKRHLKGKCTPCVIGCFLKLREQWFSYFYDELTSYQTTQRRRNTCHSLFFYFGKYLEKARYFSMEANTFQFTKVFWSEITFLFHFFTDSFDNFPLPHFPVHFKRYSYPLSCTFLQLVFYSPDHSYACTIHPVIGITVAVKWAYIKKCILPQEQRI